MQLFIKILRLLVIFRVGIVAQVAEETQEAVMEVREDENVSSDHDGQKTPTTLKNGDVVDSTSRQKAVAGSGSKVIVSHSPEGSIAARVVSSPAGSMSRLSSLGSGCSYSLSPDGSSVSCPASDTTGIKPVIVAILCHRSSSSSGSGRSSGSSSGSSSSSGSGSGSSSGSSCSCSCSWWIYYTDYTGLVFTFQVKEIAFQCLDTAGWNEGIRKCIQLVKTG